MNKEKCCPKFDPTPWDEKEIVWENETFIKDHVICFLHIPINFGAKMIKNVKLMKAAGAMPAESEFIVLSSHDTLWGMDIYLRTKKEVPKANNAVISGNFLSKVFEGSYKNTPKWVEGMKKYVSDKKREIKDLYSYYTTCPKCAQKYGKNYVVLLAKVN